MAKKKAYRYPLYLLCRALAWPLSVLPRRMVITLGRFFGNLGYWVVARQRNKCIKNLKIAFGQEKSEAEIRKIARASFQHMTLTAIELLRFPRLVWPKTKTIVEVGDVFDQYKQLLQEGKGIVSITGHIGNWELLAGTLCSSLTVQGSVLARKIYYQPYNDWLVDLRKNLRVNTLYRDQSSREILEILKTNQVIGILPDQDVDSLKGIFVDFFGVPAHTVVAPVRLALSNGTPIVASFMIRKPDGNYRFIIKKVWHPKVETTRDDAIRYYTEEWTKVFEETIREYPEQWAWMHDRWKTRAAEEQQGLHNEASVKEELRV